MNAALIEIKRTYATDLLKAGATVGEEAIVNMLLLISHQLEALHAVQAQHAEQFNRVSAGGNAVLTEGVSK